MRSVILCITVFVLIMSSTSIFALPISFRKPPDHSPEEKSGPAVQSEDVPAATENVPADSEEEIDLSQPLTLEQCIEIAQERASEIKTAQLNLMQEDIKVKDARSRYLPQVTTSGGYQFSDTVDFGWEKGNYDAAIAARYTIWDHGQREATLAQAKLGREAEYSRFNTTGQNLINNIIRAYYDVLETEKLIDVDRQLVELSKRNVEKIEAFVEAGISIEADIATARVQQATAELAVINDQNNLELAKADLAVLMGMSPITPLSVIDTPDYEHYVQEGVIEAEEINIEDAISQALANRSELAEIKANLAAMEWAQTLAKLETWPKITADAGYDLRLSDYLRERNALKGHKSWDASARVSYPIFDGGRTRRIVQKADIALMKMKESMAELERNIALEAHQASLNLERARKSLEISRVQVEDARMSLDVSQGRYNQQMIILLELLDAQARYAQSMTNQVKAFYDYKVAKGSLERAMGVLK